MIFSAIILIFVIFIGLFVIVGGVEQSGLFEGLLGNMKATNFVTFTGLTVLLSNIVSNIPAVMFLKFLIPSAHSSLWWASMAIFSTLAGNLTITGRLRI